MTLILANNPKHFRNLRVTYYLTKERSKLSMEQLECLKKVIQKSSFVYNKAINDFVST